MDNYQSNALADVGGEPLDGSGFEAERPVFEEEVIFEPPDQDREVEDK